MLSSRKKYWQCLVELLRYYTGCSCVGIRVLDINKNIPYAEYVGFTKEFWESENWISLNEDQCVCTRVFTGEWLSHDLRYITKNGSFLCNNTLELVNSLTEKQLCTFRGVCIDTGYLTVAVIPIKYQGQVLGAIHIADKVDNKLPLKTVRFIEATSIYIGETLHNFNFNKEIRQAEQDILLKNIVNQVTVDSCPGLIMLVNNNYEVITVNNLGEIYGVNEGSKCFGAIGNNAPCQWCKLSKALESRNPQQADIELNGQYYKIFWMPISSELCMHLILNITEQKSWKKKC